MKLNNRSFLNSQIENRYKETDLGDPVGLDRIGGGSNRIVYKIIDDTYGSKCLGMVMKINYPHSDENSREKRIWQKYKDTKYSNYLVPVIDSGQDWLLMPYGESVPEKLVDQKLYDVLYELGLNDLSYDDFVYINGSQMCCDYATLLR